MASIKAIVLASTLSVLVLRRERLLRNWFVWRGLKTKVPVTQTIVLPVAISVDSNYSTTLNINGVINLLNARGQLTQKTGQAKTDEAVQLRIRQVTIATSLAWILQ